MESNLKNQLPEQQIIKLSIYLRKVREIETMTANYFFEDGTEKEGNSYNTNYLSGDIYFSDIEAENHNLNNSGPFPMKDFIASFMENSWSQFIPESIDNFSGEGSSIDYDYDEFEDYEALDSEDCDWSHEHEPVSISLFFEKIELKLDSDSDAGTYKNNEVVFTKKELLNLIQKNQNILESVDPNSRYFEFKDANSKKFWEISVSGSTITVLYGKLGTNGQSSVKEMNSSEAAQKQAKKQADGKIKKGYQEVKK
tara:strand:+ start:3179 stop:3940 length:762 start_codon:yes stop_codon:yes gene_type:complete